MCIFVHAQDTVPFSACLDTAYAQASCRSYDLCFVYIRRAVQWCGAWSTRLCQALLSFVCSDTDAVLCFVSIGIRNEIRVRFVTCCGRCRCGDVVNGLQKASQRMRN